MRIKSSYLFAAGILAAVVLFLVVVSLFGGGDKATAARPDPAAKPADPAVQVRDTAEVLRDQAVLIRGRTEAARSVVVRAETSGVVAATPAAEGAAVRRGVVLCRLAVEARQATLDQARANQRSRQLQREASVRLAKQGYRSETQVLQDQADLDSASAQVRQAEIALDQVNVRAPFTGVFDHRDAEIGTYLSPGQPCGTVIELDPLLIVGDLPEAEAAKVRVGAPATAKLVSGQVLSGVVRFVARDADPQTRTYRVEVAAANPQMAARSGLSAELRLSSGLGPAHLVPVSSLVLDAEGRQGVRYVQGDSRVAFAPVRVLEQTAEGAWVSGLRGAARVIVVGQSYVGDGQRVRVALAR